MYVGEAKTNVKEKFKYTEINFTWVKNESINLVIQVVGLLLWSGWQANKNLVVYDFLKFKNI